MNSAMTQSLHPKAFDAPMSAPNKPFTARAPSLAPRALYEQVAERLRQQIFSREIEPDGRIDEQKLAEEYRISRTPMREALKVLATEGLVTMKMRRGSHVAEMSVDDVRQVYRLLSLLESDAAVEIAQSASEEDLADLRQLHERLEKLVRPRDAYFAANERFTCAC